MRRRTLVRIGLAMLVLFGLALASLAIAVSYDAECGTAAPAADGAPGMRAAVHRCYGSADVISLERIPKPVPAEDEVLVRVHSAGVNPLDWHYLTGTPYIMRLSVGLGAPESPRMGVDFSGTVEAVGAKVTRFKPGHEVFGGRNGAFAEYVTVRADRALVHKPPNISFEQAASVGIAGVTALQALRDEGRLLPGQKVLINGASGGVGTFAVQIAKAMGAEVTGVCSTRNVELVRSLGADHVIDYTQEDFTEGDERYDLIVDNVGNHPLLAVRRALKPEGIVVMVGGPKSDPWLGPMARPIKAALISPFIDEELAMFMASLNQADLEILGTMMRDGTVAPVIDRQFALGEVADAIRYLATGRARGKIVLRVEQGGEVAGATRTPAGARTVANADAVR